MWLLWLRILYEFLFNFLSFLFKRYPVEKINANIPLLGEKICSVASLPPRSICITCLDLCEVTDVQIELTSKI